MSLYHQRKYRILGRGSWHKLSTKPKAVRLSPRSIWKQLLSTYLNHNVDLTLLKLSLLSHHSNTTCLDRARLTYDHAFNLYLDAGKDVDGWSNKCIRCYFFSLSVSYCNILVYCNICHRWLRPAETQFFLLFALGVNNRESTTDDISIHVMKRNLFQGKNCLVKFGLDNLRLIPNFF